MWYWWKHIWHWAHWEHHTWTQQVTIWTVAQNLFKKLHNFFTHYKNYTIVKNISLPLLEKSDNRISFSLLHTLLHSWENRAILLNPVSPSAKLRSFTRVASPPLGVWQLKQLLCSHHYLGAALQRYKVQLFSLLTGGEGRTAPLPTFLPRWIINTFQTVKINIQNTIVTSSKNKTMSITSPAWKAAPI